MKTLILIFPLCLLNVLYGYNCPVTMLQSKICIVKIPHCLPVYPDWNKCVCVCSEAKFFVSGTCPVYFKKARKITSVPCPAMYYTDKMYRSNQIDIPKLKHNCTEKGQLTYVTNSSLNNLCYCEVDFSLEINETYCNPSLRSCSCHRKTTDDINKDDSSDLWNIHIPVVAAVISFILACIAGIAGVFLYKKCRTRQTKKSETEIGAESYSSEENNVDLRLNAAVTYQQSIQETQGACDTHSTVQLYGIDRHIEEQLPLMVTRCRLTESTDNPNREYESDEPDFMDLPQMTEAHGTSPINKSVEHADKVLAFDKTLLGSTSRDDALT